MEFLDKINLELWHGLVSNARMDLDSTKTWLNASHALNNAHKIYVIGPEMILVFILKNL